MIQEIFNYLWTAIATNINWMIVVLVIVSGYFQRYYLKNIKVMGDAVKTLLVSFIVTTIYLSLIGDIYDRQALARFFFSYFISTSLYEIILKPLTEIVVSRINAKKYDP